MIHFLKNSSFLFLALVILSCTRSREIKTEEVPDTPVSGTITVAADESFYPIVKAEVDAFQSIYTDARIKTDFQSEDEAIMALLNGKADMIFISRPLNKREQEFIKNKQITTRSNKIATDAVAFIVNESLSDSLITTNQLKSILSGTVRNWKDLNPQLADLGIEIVVDKSTSSNLSFLRDTMGLHLPTVKVYAAGSNQKVMEHVKKNQASLGIIGMNWISDEDDPELRQKLKGIKVLAVGKGNEKDTSRFYEPVQEYVAAGSYPFIRPIIVINKSTKTGLASGLASYMVSDKGQRIILKAGLLPAQMPGRELEFKEEQ